MNDTATAPMRRSRSSCTAAAAESSATITGGMAAKVEQMLELSREVAGLTAEIFSAEEGGHLSSALAGTQVGTQIFA